MIISPANRLNNVQEYYFSKKLKEIRSLNAQGKDIINLGIGSPDLAPSTQSIEALCYTAKQTESHGYQSYTGIPALRESIANWSLKTYSTTLSPDNEILPLMGSKEGIMHISMAFLNKGDKVLVPNPGYPSYSSVSNLLEADIENYELDENLGWNINIQSLKQKDLSKVKLMWINFPNMPTGSHADVGILNELISLAKEHRFLIINDNPYSLILNDNPFSIFQLKGAKEVCIELNSLSKSHNMAGWRIGWLAGDSRYLNTVLKVKSNMDSGMFLALQNAAIKAFDNTEDWHKKQNNIYQERKNLIGEIFDYLKVSYDKNSTGMFIWGKVSDELDNVEDLVNQVLYEANVFITPGFIFGSKGDRYIRASLCANKEVIKKALERIKRHL
ncbi:MAG: LL-diaminopimelate aminotransferase [Saprospiraceae bacterium]|jgi:LL-diaminopimelate aminotransferase